MINGGTFLPPITLRTTAQPGDNKYWADLVGNFNGTYWTAAQGFVNFDDVFAAISTWQNSGARAHGPSTIIPRTDVVPQEPNRIVNFNDVLFVVLAFQGDYYPFGCPDDPCQDNIENPCP